MRNLIALGVGFVLMGILGFVIYLIEAVPGLAEVIACGVAGILSIVIAWVLGRLTLDIIQKRDPWDA